MSVEGGWAMATTAAKTGRAGAADYRPRGFPSSGTLQWPHHCGSVFKFKFNFRLSPVATRPARSQNILPLHNFPTAAVAAQIETAATAAQIKSASGSQVRDYLRKRGINVAGPHLLAGAVAPIPQFPRIQLGITRGTIASDALRGLLHYRQRYGPVTGVLPCPAY